MKFRIIAVTADGNGHDHSWGDRYEIEAHSYAEAETTVLAMDHVPGTRAYSRIVRAWQQDENRLWQPVSLPE